MENEEFGEEFLVDDIVLDDESQLLESRQLILVEIILRILEHEQQRNTADRRAFWVRPFWERGAENPYHAKLMRDLRAEGDDFFRNFAHVSQEQFDFLCETVRPLVQKQDTPMRVAITVEERVAVTLKHLAHGDSYHTLSQVFRISWPAIVGIIPVVCSALFTKLAPEYLKTPSTAEEWEKIANDFETKWNYPNCIGALDGKHVVCKAPASTGSAFYNYKGTFSVVLMALVDANYKFIYVNIGAKGSGSDGGIFSCCKLSTALETNSLNLPPDRPLPGRIMPVPFCIVADEAFAASSRIMKPIGNRNLSTLQRVYNYRLSRARRIVENAFGILSGRWRILRRAMEHSTDTINKIISAICVLHNFCTAQKLEYATQIADRDNEGEIALGQWRQDEQLLPLRAQSNRTQSTATNAIREEYINYFTSERGELAWQYTVR